MKVTFIGHGYVGLVTAAVMSDFGNEVFVIGRTPDKIEKLNKGIIPIYEPGLEELVKRNLKTGRLKFTLDFEKPVSASDVVIIAVGTPSSSNGEADLSSVFEVAKNLAKYLKPKFTVVATKSTVPVGTNRKIIQIINKFKPKNADFAIASIPEFLKEGTGIEDTLKPDRVIIGVENKKAEEILKDLHSPISNEPFIVNIETAEMIKYAANSFLATKISFANAISFLCEKSGANVKDVMEGIGLDKRIGKEFLKAGIGYGGSCFPKDVKALIKISQNLGYDFKLLKMVSEINEKAHQNFLAKIENYFKNLKNKKLAVLGLSFKPNTDDLRDAPSIPIINYLLKKDVQIKAYDPVAMDNAKKYFPKISYAKNPYDCAKNADALLIITEWNEFKELDLFKIKKVLKNPVIFDGRNLYNRKDVEELGFKYFGVGV